MYLSSMLIYVILCDPQGDGTLDAYLTLKHKTMQFEEIPQCKMYVGALEYDL